MKSTTLFAFFLLSAFSSHLPSATVAFVHDTDGDLLQNGGSYYILPVFRGRGGGIEQAAIGNETCPLTVVQARSEVSLGLPIRIASPYRILYIYEGLILDLSFNHVPTCAPKPSKWTIVKGLTETPSVKLTGYHNTVSGWFHIEKSFQDYKLVFCEIHGDSCTDIGVHIDDDGNRLLVAVKDNPLTVQFKKASSEDLLKEA